ncbi:MAG: hypothetical protein HQL28_07275, partial [Candidatus Omnitrophica bacterium]|nr:hypothetical protein [Candidatus Omnitrophota bacterium]
LMRQREDVDPDVAYQRKRVSLLKRLIGGIRSVKEEIRVLKLLPAPVITEIEKLIAKLETEVK